MKENSWDGDEEEEGGEELLVVGFSWPDDDGPWYSSPCSGCLLCMMVVFSMAKTEGGMCELSTMVFE